MLKPKTEKTILQNIVKSGATLHLFEGAVYLEGASNEMRGEFQGIAHDIQAKLIPGVTDDQRQQVKNLIGNRQVVFVADDERGAHFVDILLSDAALSGNLAIDTETMVPPDLQAPVEVAITKSGTIAARQPLEGSAGYALNPRKGKVRLIQAYAGGGSAVLFDMSQVSWEVVASLFHGTHTISMFNATFDIKMLITSGGVEPTCRIYDTQTAMRLLDPCEGWPLSMAKAADILLDIKLPKTLGESDWSAGELSSDQLDYAALDVLITHALWRRQREVFDRQDENVCNITDGCLIAVSRMELAGMPVDRSVHQGFIDSWNEELAAATERLAIATNGVFSKAPSPQEVRAYLNKTLTDDQLKTWPRSPKSRELEANKDVLKQHGHSVPGIPEIIDVNVWSKGLSTYGDSLLQKVEDDGRLHANFKIAGCRTGRFSSSDPNIQNIPKRNKVFTKFRQIFKAPEGYVVMWADYSQIELRQIAEISGDENMRNAYREYGRHHRDKEARAPFDIHRVTARGLRADFDSLPPDEQDSYRSLAKGMNFGLTYGSGSIAFQKYLKTAVGVDVDIDEAARMIRVFGETYPGIKSWQDQQTRESKALGCAQTIGGRRWYWEWRSKNPWDIPEDMESYKIDAFLRGFERNFSLNLPVQGTCAEIMCLALAHIDRRLRGYDARLVATVHDEVVLLVKDDAETLRKTHRVVLQSMTRAWLEFNPNAPWRGIVDLNVAPTWAG